MQVINSFQGQYRFLSNFYPAQLEFHGTMWPTSEHAYQAAKTMDLEGKRLIQEANSPGAAKRAGRRVKIRSDWEKSKVLIMHQIVEAKFLQNPDLLLKLHETGDARLVEGNTWNDTFWGICDGRGENHLGTILEIVRMRTLKE